MFLHTLYNKDYNKNTCMYNENILTL